jgi:hypothetical protein
VEQDYVAEQGDCVSDVEHRIAFEDEDYPKGAQDPLDAWWDELPELELPEDDETLYTRRYRQNSAD